MQQDANKAVVVDGRGQADGSDAPFAAYRAALRAFVSRRILDPHEAEDLVQEACTRLIATARSVRWMSLRPICSGSPRT